MLRGFLYDTMNYERMPDIAGSDTMLNHIVAEARRSGRTGAEVVAEMKEYLDVGFLSDKDWNDLERTVRVVCTTLGIIGAPFTRMEQNARNAETQALNQAARASVEQLFRESGLSPEEDGMSL